MRKTTDRNFQKRFGGRISMTFADKHLSPTAQKVQNNALYKAITEIIMRGVLGREPTEREIMGVEDISGCKDSKE